MLPSFQEAPRCTACNAPFSTFRRRHHCRCCGKSLCSEHSSNQMALPQFGIKSAVRVCDDCFHASKQTINVVEGSDGVDIDVSKSSDLLQTLHLSTEGDQSLVEQSPSVSSANTQPSQQCTCGMPLCICQIPAPIAKIVPSTPVVMATVSKKSHSTSSVTTSTHRRPINAASSSEFPSLFFSSPKPINNASEPATKKYDSTTEGIWEAVKNGDVKAVKDLLSDGVDPNYQDKQGMSLLHLAAVFNFTEIACLLMDWGAKADVKNAQGESPLDCAPATLQYKMQQKLKSKLNQG